MQIFRYIGFRFPIDEKWQNAVSIKTSWFSYPSLPETIDLKSFFKVCIEGALFLDIY